MSSVAWLTVGLGLLLVGTTLACGSGDVTGPTGECDPGPTEPPPTPRLLSALRITPTMAVVRWDAGSARTASAQVSGGPAAPTTLTCVQHLTAYRLYRATAPDAPRFGPVCLAGVQCAHEAPDTDPGPFEYVDTLPSSTDTFYYYVTAENDAGVSAPSTLQQVDPLGP